MYSLKLIKLVYYWLCVLLLSMDNYCWPTSYYPGHAQFLCSRKIVFDHFSTFYKLWMQTRTKRQTNENTFLIKLSMVWENQVAKLVVPNSLLLYSNSWHHGHLPSELNQMYEFWHLFMTSSYSCTPSEKRPQQNRNASLLLEVILLALWCQVFPLVSSICLWLQL